LAERLSHGRGPKETAETSSVLHRGIHRLEKGILDKSRRDIFAVHHIQETVNFHECAVQ
jgi:hypothetical protein